MKKFIVALAVSAMLMTGSAMAADWNFYGSARVSTFYVDSDLADSTNYEEGLQGNSRIGATVKVSDELTGGFEYGTGVNVRKLYGEWNFGAGTLLVGQTYTPLNLFYSNQVYGVDNDMLAQGGIYSGREAMLRLKFGGFTIAALAPATGNTTGTTGGVTNEVDFPSFEAKYVYKFDSGSVALTGGYQSYEMTDANDDYDINSYVLAVGGSLGFGAAYLNGNIYIGQNAGDMIAVSVDGDNGWDDGYADVTGGVLADNDVFGLLIAAGYTVNDMVTLEIGYAYAETELDNAATEDEVCTYYLQSVITLAPGVMVIPEIGRIDGEEAGDEETTYFGAKWQINF